MSIYTAHLTAGKDLKCECGKRVTRADIKALMEGEVLKCGYCNSLVWFDENSWATRGDMSYHYIRWGTDPQNHLRISFWFLSSFLKGAPVYSEAITSPLPFAQSPNF